MRQEGTLADWKADRGFGFISPVAGGPRIFVHISEFPRGTRPVPGVLLTYAQGQDESMRPRAIGVQLVGPGRSRGRRSPGLFVALACTAVFFALLVVLVVTERAPALLLAPYLLFSALAFLMYRSDKAAAVRGTQRVRERNLHLVALMGGWPGALVAQQALRHKTKKQPFRTIFWGTVIANCATLAWLVVETPRLLG